MTCNVLMGTLNPTHSLTDLYFCHWYKIGNLHTLESHAMRSVQNYTCKCYVAYRMIQSMCCVRYTGRWNLLGVRSGVSDQSGQTLGVFHSTSTTSAMHRLCCLGRCHEVTACDVAFKLHSFNSQYCGTTRVYSPLIWQQNVKPFVFYWCSKSWWRRQWWQL